MLSLSIYFVAFFLILSINCVEVYLENKTSSNVAFNVQAYISDALEKKNAFEELKILLENDFDHLANRSQSLVHNQSDFVTLKKYIDCVNEGGFCFHCKKKEISVSFQFPDRHPIDKLANYTNDNHTGVSFEMNFAFKTPKKGFVRLTGNYDTVFDIGIGENYNQESCLFTRHPKLSLQWPVAKTPNILSADRFTKFYLQVNNGTLEFGQKDGLSNRKPIITESHKLFKLLRYYSFASTYPSTLYYDC